MQQEVDATFQLAASECADRSLNCSETWGSPGQTGYEVIELYQQHSTNSINSNQHISRLSHWWIKPDT